MTTKPYLDADKQPLEQNRVYALGNRFYLIDKPLPKDPTTPLDLLDDNYSRQMIQPSAVSHMHKLDRMQMQAVANILRTQVNFLEKQLAQTSRKCTPTETARARGSKEAEHIGGGWR